MVFRLSDDNSEVIVDTTGAPTAGYDEFIQALPDNDCRYAVYNVEYSTEDGERAKFVFFLWYVPPSCLLSSFLPAPFLRFFLIFILPSPDSACSGPLTRPR